jgi:hypothetical protein
MAKTAKTQQSRLTPTPKELDKALEKSAKQALALATAFGATVPYARVKTTGTARKPGQ